MTTTISNLLIRWRFLGLGCAAIAAALAYFPAAQLEYDRAIENMFAPDDPLVTRYERLKRVFGGNEIVLAVYQDPGLLRPDGAGIRRCAAIRQRLAAVPGVKGVLGIDVPLGPAIADPESGLGQRYLALFQGYTHGQDGRTAALVCMLAPVSDRAPPRRQTIDRLRSIMEDLPDGLAPGMLAGEPVMVVDGFRYVEEDGRRLGVASTLLLAAVMVVCFRSVRWVVIPLAVVQLTLVLTRGILRVSGLRLTIVSSMLTAVVTVVGVAAMMHVIVRYRDARREGNAPPEALRRATALLITPIVWACATDAAGFASLMIADVGPVHDYGLMMAIGSLLVLVTAALLVPGMALLGRWDADPREAWGERLLDVPLDRSAAWTRRYPLQVGLGAGLLACAISVGVMYLQVETDFTKNFRADSPLVRSYRMVETNLGGAGILDVVVPAPPRLDWPYIERVLHLERRLRDEVRVATQREEPATGLTKVLSLADAIEAAVPRETLESTPPALRDGILAMGMAVMQRQMPEFLRALYGQEPDQSGPHYLRIMLRAHERQPSQSKRQLVEQVERISREEFPTAEVTGFFVLLTSLIDSVLRDQWLAFGLATLAVGGMMIVPFRSVRLALIALVPNTVPILVVLGGMGWLGLRINLGAAMIAAVSVGLSVDSSIHYITSFRRALSRGMSVDQAIGSVQQTVGRAMIFSTLALVVGFSVLCTSPFIPTVYFGFLVGLSMLGGLSGNLVILPLLLSRLVRPAARTSVDVDGDRPRARPTPPPAASGSSGT